MNFHWKKSVRRSKNHEMNNIEQDYSSLHHIVPVQSHKGINPETAPVPALKVEIREGTVKRRLAF